MGKRTITEQVKELVRAKGLARRRDVEEAGFPPYLLYRLRDRGELMEIAPGLFKHPETEFTEKHSFAEASKLVPRGVVCLLSALAFHEVGTQMPRRMWMALNRENRQEPEVSDPPMEFVWFKGSAFEEGQEVHEVEGVDVRVYSVAKTIADLFKYRKKLGLDVALEALHQAWRDRLFTMDELDHYADVCRVRKVIRPYLQVLTTSP